MKLHALLAGAGIPAPLAENPEIAGVTEDSRQVRPGWLFVAVEGTRQDGHEFIPQALAAGAAAIVSPRRAPADSKVAWTTVADVRRAAGSLAHAFFNHPSRGMNVAGVTGTNGKTTTAWLLESIFRAAGHKTGLLGTLGYTVAGERFEAATTTASATRNAGLFAQMRDAGVTAAAMEVSSHAVDQRRIEGIEFRAGVFTNLTQDHLDYHKTMEEYSRAKWRFFEEWIGAPTAGVAAFNLDDETGREFSRRYCGAQVRFGRHDKADVRLETAECGLRGIVLRIQTAEGSRLLHSPLIGGFNVENTLAAVAGGLAAGIPMDAIAHGIESASNVPGRFERIDEGQSFLVAVDYAHTSDALERVMANARSMTERRLIVVFGCGGDRDKTKRPKMGFAVGRGADQAVLTNDNPRTERPEEIATMAEEGLRKAGMAPGRYEVILDRRAAIRLAIGRAEAGDFVLIAGKGHEDYQIIGESRIHFDDREEARAALRGSRARL